MRRISTLIVVYMIWWMSCLVVSKVIVMNHQTQQLIPQQYEEYKVLPKHISKTLHKTTENGQLAKSISDKKLSYYSNVPYEETYFQENEIRINNKNMGKTLKNTDDYLKNKINVDRNYKKAEENLIIDKPQYQTNDELQGNDIEKNDMSKWISVPLHENVFYLHKNHDFSDTKKSIKYNQDNNDRIDNIFNLKTKERKIENPMKLNRHSLERKQNPNIASETSKKINKRTRNKEFIKNNLTSKSRTRLRSMKRNRKRNKKNLKKKKNKNSKKRKGNKKRRRRKNKKNNRKRRREPKIINQDEDIETEKCCQYHHLVNCYGKMNESGLVQPCCKRNFFINCMIEERTNDCHHNNYCSSVDMNELRNNIKSNFEYKYPCLIDLAVCSEKVS